MVYEFRLPDIGEGIAEGEVVKWHVKEGIEVKENDPLVEIMTDKVNVEISSPKKGTILKLMAKEGEVVKVGQVLLAIEEKGEQTTITTSALPTFENSTKSYVETKVPSAGSSVAVAQRPHEILATPATRKLARDLDIDLSQVQGTGPGGRVLESDIHRFKKSGAQAPTVAAPTPENGGEERIPLRGIRRKMAERMVISKHTAAHVTHVDEIDMTEIVQLRYKTKEFFEKRGGKLTYLPFIIKALIPALMQYPYLNATLDDKREEIVLKKYYNIGVATNTEQGLVVPVLKGADHKSITQLADEIIRLSDRARTGQLTLDEIQGSTFTITNIGGIGGLFATPIINYPEVAILGVHKITKRPIVQEDRIVIRDMTYLSLSFDHRVLDGAMAAEFMNVIKQRLEDPKLLQFETD
jgi:pyruvate dehydrogenase E2 component (dihydrolipoamide acetyltransferase)